MGFFSKILFLFSVQAVWGGIPDYWDEDFDLNKNCKQEEKITKLFKEVGAHDLNKDEKRFYRDMKNREQIELPLLSAHRQW